MVLPEAPAFLSRVPMSRLRPILCSLMFVLVVQPGLAGPPEGSRPGPRWSLARLGTVLKTGLVAVLAASDPHGLGAMAQPFTFPGGLNLMPAFNLSGSDPTSVFAAQGVDLALLRANLSGNLPPLADLNAMLARSSPQGASVLDTLPSPAALAGQSTGVSLPRLPSFLLNPPADQAQTTVPSTDALAAAQSALTVAQLTDVFYIVESIAQQLLADSTLLLDTPKVAQALEFAGFQLASIAFSFAAAASIETTAAAQRALVTLQAPQPAPPAHRVVPGVERLYGSWERLETSSSPQIVVYKFSRDEFVNITTVTGGEDAGAIEVDSLPGPVAAHLSIRPSGEIRVTVKVHRDGDQPLVLKFIYLKAESSGDDPDSLETLVEQDGARRAFVKISND